MHSALNSAVFGEASETADVANEIPRLDRIPNPQEPIQPTETPDPDEFNLESFTVYADFIKNVLPSFDLNFPQQAQNVLETLKGILENDINTSLACELSADNLIFALLICCDCNSLDAILDVIDNKYACDADSPILIVLSISFCF